MGEQHPNFEINKCIEINNCLLLSLASKIVKRKRPRKVHPGLNDKN